MTRLVNDLPVFPMTRLVNDIQVFLVARLEDGAEPVPGLPALHHATTT